MADSNIIFVFLNWLVVWFTRPKLVLSRPVTFDPEVQIIILGLSRHVNRLHVGAGLTRFVYSGMWVSRYTISRMLVVVSRSVLMKIARMSFLISSGDIAIISPKGEEV